GRYGGGDALLDPYLAVGPAVVPRRLRSPQRVPVDPVGTLEKQRLAGGRAVAVRRRIGDGALPPAIVAARPAGTAGALPSVHLRNILRDLGRNRVEEPALGGGRARRQLHLAHVDLEAQVLARESVAEALVDAALAGPEHRERLVAGADVAQLAVHQAG